MLVSTLSPGSPCPGWGKLQRARFLGLIVALAGRGKPAVLLVLSYRQAAGQDLDSGLPGEAFTAGLVFPAASMCLFKTRESQHWQLTGGGRQKVTSPDVAHRLSF